MKKLTAVLLCVILLISCLPFAAFAATDDSQIDVNEVLKSTVLSVSLSSAETTAHKDVTLDLTVDSNPGFSVMLLNLSFGTESITLKSVESKVSGVTADFSNQSGAATLAFYHLGSDCTVVGTLATLTFSVGAFSGVAPVALSAEEGDICNNDAASLEAVLNNGSITVNCISDSHYYVYEGTTQASCTKKGEIKYVCTVCGDVKITYIDEIDHVAKSEWEVIKQPDCDTQGYSALLCQYCFTELDTEPIAALGHKYTDDPEIVTNEPTCTVAGSKYKVCYVCGYKHVTEIAALGHDEGTWRTTIPSDCLNSGIASRYCNRCDYVLETMETEVGSHFCAWSVVKEPTCSEPGVEDWLCVVCGGVKTNSREIPVLDHTPGDEAIVREATCSEEGLAEIHCKDCDHLISSRSIEKLDHIKNTLKVVTAPTNTNEGSGEYRCKECDYLMESVVLPVANGVFYIETEPTLRGKTATVKVFLKDNPGFSVGILRIKYNVASLIYKGIAAGEVTADITSASPAEGELRVVLSLGEAELTKNGLVFTLEFTLTADAEDTAIQLTYDPQNDFSDEKGELVFVNTESGEIPVLEFVRGDADGDGSITGSDLAAMKLYLVGAVNTIAEGADIDRNGKVDAGDLAALKLHLAGAAIIK